MTSHSYSVFNENNLSLGKCIGKGTFSLVYEAHLKTQSSWNFTSIALKKVSINEMTDDRAKTDCLNELRLLQRLTHPNIIRYFFWELNSDGILNIFLELADAGDLARLICDYENRVQLIDERIIWHYLEQICSALHYMHSNRIMHRDLKPANIFLTSDRVIKLGDLGLSKYFPDNGKSTHSVLGSPYYMSPERLLRDKYDFNGDIWSLGCVLYELAAFRSPFYVHKTDLNLLIRKVIKCDYAPLPSDSYSVHVSKIIGKCLSVNPAKRPSAQYVRNKAKKYSRQLQTKL